MVEGPGHVPFDQVEYNMKLQRRLCHGAPVYVLGPQDNLLEAWKHERSILNLIGKFLRLLPAPSR